MERQKLGDKMYVGKSSKGPKTKPPKKNLDFVASRKKNFGKERAFSSFDAVPDEASSLNCVQGAEAIYGDAQSHNGTAEADFMRFERRVLFNLDCKSKMELHDLKTKLQSELTSVRSLLERVEHFSWTKSSLNDTSHGGKLKRVHSEVESSKVGREMKAVSKVGQFPRTSDSGFVKEKIPSSSQTKKSKINGQKLSDDSGSFLGMRNSSSKVFKSCSTLLDKLMKQKNAWVFNNPVDVEGLGLHDYFTIIKNPMDLGTVKSRLNTNRYRTPEEYAEDVRLTFQNAMTYNMEGHEINVLAKQLLKMFEEKWAGIEAEYLGQFSSNANSEVEVPTPAPPRAPPATPPPPPPLVDVPMAVDRSESTTNPTGSEPKVSHSLASGRSRLPKPKAKDPNKREMTLHEKQKLSVSLQDLPPEKLDGVLRIIKKRNPSLCQNDDEIEVDIDSVDTETLWELDRFVIYYKKNLSKMKRSAEFGLGMKMEPNTLEKNEAHSGRLEKENETDDKNIELSPSVEGEKGVSRASLSGGSSSSSSDSGSSSSESDTDSSSS